MNTNYSQLIALRIRTGLKEAKISQTELAQMIEKSRAYISNITKGRYLPKISELVKISQYLKKPVGYFMGEDTPGLMNYVDKAKKWDRLVSLIDTDIRKDFKDDVIPVPLLDNSKLRNKSLNELLELKNNATEFVYLSKAYVKNYLKYFNPIEDLVGVTVFIRDYPEFGIYLGDISFFEPVQNNDIGENSGKLFGVLYKGDVGIKRIYRDGKLYYFEPVHSSPEIEKISADDPNLVIAGRIIFNLHMKLF